MEPPVTWGQWFVVALPVSFISILLIWGLLLASYKPARAPDGGRDIEIKLIRPTRERFTLKQWWVTLVCLVTIALWCFAHEIKDYVGDMGVIAIIPIVAFFATGVLKKVGVPWHAALFLCVLGLMCSCVHRMTLSSLRGRLCSSRWAGSHWAKASPRAACWRSWT